MSFAETGNSVASQQQSQQRKRQRKSRSKGLRAKSGCATCRKRHLKCDEGTPVCKNCLKGNRACSYGAPNTTSESSGHAVGGVLSVLESSPPQPNAVPPVEQISQAAPRTSINAIIDLNVPPPMGTSPSQPNVSPTILYSTVRSREADAPAIYSPNGTESTLAEAPSPNDFLTADSASNHWLSLLASDAARGHGGFTLEQWYQSRPVSVSPQQTHAGLGSTSVSSPDDARRVAQQRLSVSSASNFSFSPYAHLPISPERSFWQSAQPVKLREFELPIFRNFVERLSRWIDLFDPEMHFSIYVPRLALHNVGLMKAILALSARHLSLNETTKDLVRDENAALQYYYETLHYLQTAMQSETYQRSDELIATALVVSTYEMLDESGSGWQRHLKGVFLIQRSRDINGESGGLKQAVWWAWLRQDVWAAFRERRKAHSFFKPTKRYENMTQHELANRSVYLLKLAVDYCSDVEVAKNQQNLQERMTRADTLLGKLEAWRASLGYAFIPLPVKQDDSSFEPIWIHPPNFGVALQIYSFARILLLLHRPSTGVREYLNTQKALNQSVKMICGIAMTQEDEACNLIASQCLYGAGLCIDNQRQRQVVLDLIDKCQRRTGWTACCWKKDLQEEWKSSDVS